MASTDYRRSPLPKEAKTPVGWFALCFMGLILSPFVGFAVYGNVAEPGLVIGLFFAVIPLSGLAAIAITRWRAWRRLPLHIAEEWTSGRIVPARGAPTVAPPVRFSNKKYWIEMLPEGLALSRSSLLTMQGVPETSAKLWAAELAGDMFIPWADIVEWGVDTDSDGPNYYSLKLRSRGMLKIRRFRPDTATECDLLDAVRSIGHLPVRIRCDIECE